MVLRLLKSTPILWSYRNWTVMTLFRRWSFSTHYVFFGVGAEPSKYISREVSNFKRSAAMRQRGDEIWTLHSSIWGHMKCKRKVSWEYKYICSLRWSKLSQYCTAIYRFPRPPYLSSLRRNQSTKVPLSTLLPLFSCILLLLCHTVVLNMCFPTTNLLTING